MLKYSEVAKYCSTGKVIMNRYKSKNVETGSRNPKNQRWETLGIDNEEIIDISIAGVLQMELKSFFEDGGTLYVFPVFSFTGFIRIGFWEGNERSGYFMKKIEPDIESDYPINSQVINIKSLVFSYDEKTNKLSVY